jgi:23S rRNA pseudouridine2605 synthase
MDDDRKKPPRGRTPGRTGSKGGDATRKPFRPRPEGTAKADAGGERSVKPRGPRPDRSGGDAPRPFRPKAPRDGAPSGDGPRKPYKPRFEAGGEGGESKRPFKPRSPRAESTGADGPRRAYKPRFEAGDKGGEGERSFKPRSPRPESAGANGPRKPYKPRAERSGDGGDRPYTARPPRDGAPSGEGFRKPFRPRPDQSLGDDAKGERTFKPRGPRTDRPTDGTYKPRRPRDDGAPSGERGFRPRERNAEGRPAFAERSDRQRRTERPAGSAAGGDAPLRRARKPEEETLEPGRERIAKRLARAGVASRRDAEQLIEAGRVKVNGRVLDTPAFVVSIDDAIEIDGQPLPPVERTRLFLFHKPGGVVTTNRDPEGRRTVFDVLPEGLPRLVTIGRLDINTEGLLLLTNDGGLARVLELPATGWLRRYRARVHGKIEQKQLDALKDGVAIDGVFYGAVEASLDREQGSNAWLTIGLREGKNREVKNILGSLGLDVTRLIRISFGPFQLGELPEGHVQELKGKMLRDQLGERLIEEAGANFDADIAKPFSNKPVRRERDVEPEAAKPRTPRPLRIGEGGLIKRRKDREGARDEALGKLSTRPERAPRARSDESRPAGGKGERPGGKSFGKPERPLEPRRPRGSNVWMAPGSRPVGTGAAARAAEDKASTRKPRKGGTDRGGGAGPDDRPRGGDRPSRGPRKGGDADRRR